MAIIVPIEVNIFNALFFFLHEFLFLAAIHFFLGSFVNRKIREKLSKGESVSVKQTSFLHVFSTNTRTWSGILAIMLMVLIWISVPFTELGISATDKFTTATARLVHLKFGEQNRFNRPTFPEVIAAAPEDQTNSDSIAFYKLNPFFYSVSKCSLAVVNDIGQNVGSEFFDFYLDPVEAAEDSLGADLFNGMISQADVLPPETACRNGLGGRDKLRLAKIYQLVIADFEPLRFEATRDGNDELLITGQWNSTLRIHTRTVINATSDASFSSGVCLLDESNRSILLSADTASLRIVEETDGQVQIQIEKGPQDLGYRISTSIESPQRVCEELGRQVPNSLLNTVDEIFGRFVYPLSSLELADDAVATVDQKDATKVETWAVFVYFVPLTVAFLVCLIGIFKSDPGAETISKEVTGYSGIAKMLIWRYNRDFMHRKSGVNMSQSMLELEKKIPVEVKEEGEELYLSREPHDATAARWQQQQREAQLQQPNDSPPS